MLSIIRCSLALVILALAVNAVGIAPLHPTRPFDVFGDIKCEWVLARLDNFAVQLQNEPTSKGAIIFFAGKMAGNKLPLRGEAEARVAPFKSYLLQRSGVPADHLIVIDGGYDDYYRVELWIVPPGAALPAPEWHASVKDLRFRKGHVNPRHYRCGV
jgi:hypothetical protein